jgi:hypothetical protein
MSRRRFNPPLNKRHFASRDGCEFYTVSAFAVRNAAEVDEEFDNFADREDFPDLIPEGEVWISDKVARREGQFFIANALARLQARAEGASAETAYTVGLNAERKLRAEVTGLEYRAGKPHQRIPGKVYVREYATIPDERFPIKVWRVDGCVVRCFYKTDYVEGGHGYVYPWVPKDEIWVETALDPAEVPFIVTHEYTEHRLMRDEGLDYARAHRISSRVEFALRKQDTRAAFPGFGRLKPTRDDVPRLADPEFFEYVRRHYARGVLGRAAAAVADAVGALVS